MDTQIDIDRQRDRQTDKTKKDKMFDRKTSRQKDIKRTDRQMESRPG